MFIHRKIEFVDVTQDNAKILTSASNKVKWWDSAKWKRILIFKNISSIAAKNLQKSDIIAKIIYW